MSPHPGNARGAHPDKRTLRRKFLAVRNTLPMNDVRKTELVLAERAFEVPEVAEARTVAAYVSVGGEPGTAPLLDALRARGTRVLLPVLLPDNDLDWGTYEGPSSLVDVQHPGRMALLEPGGERLGPDAVTAADVVLLPGLAVDARGMRLGRGGGSYDRVLARLEAAGAHPALVVLLYDAEVVEHLPMEAHDKAVHAVVTPSGARRFT
ncbi:5-formyltetrahydrofolate cyclo-ligase [Streptomyces kunmingensis]|uniref:5-formyltetrahydrofolate cyclo-ligase n=1 Tax=Streptomyces kunmingensis TaxID=68225 RepID=A0ABU6CF88_9ACTN|nr:5-formyltetrahydrofolate cyclo-ligase [Streptomyces kunmingensis]MEB3963383.1 5-formyltetrahydrofolate cyclo-ligase [Streptomyces kunmingensis]MEB3963384.1 5-formyltetrahydrofolate cyclo-ligase [Streptomyces kunmingensis]